MLLLIAATLINTNESNRTVNYDAMQHTDKKHQVNFSGPAIYKITVDGELGMDMSGRIGGMQIKVDRSGPGEPTSMLVGRIDDQAALSGVLNTLYEFHLSILSVNRLKEETK